MKVACRASRSYRDTIEASHTKGEPQPRHRMAVQGGLGRQAGPGRGIGACDLSTSAFSSRRARRSPRI